MKTRSLGKGQVRVLGPTARYHTLVICHVLTIYMLVVPNGNILFKTLANFHPKTIHQLQYNLN